MKLKTFISIIALIAIMQFINPVAPAVSNSDHILPGKAEGSPQYKDGKFNDMGNALDMSFLDYVSTTWDFLFTNYFLVEIRATSMVLKKLATSTVHLT